MVRQLNQSRGWKATLAIFGALALVTSHIMACVESPMSFSPTGDLGFTVLDEWDDDEYLATPESAHFRVMILRKDGTLQELERSSDHVLTAPAFSPDGALLAYLRIPQPTEEEWEAITERLEAFVNGDPTGWPEGEWMPVGPGHPVDDGVPAQTSGTATAEADDQGEMPEVKTTEFPVAIDPLASQVADLNREFGEIYNVGGGVMRAQLVVLDPATGAHIDEIPLLLPSVMQDQTRYTYGYAHPSFSPDGRRIYVAAQYFGYAIDLDTREVQILSYVLDQTLSPDGETVAEYQSGAVALRETDGSRVIYATLVHKGAGSLGRNKLWIGNDRLTVLGRNDANRLVLDSYDRDGVPQGTTVLDWTLPSDETGSIEHIDFAVAPNGQFMTVVHDDGVLFLSSDGKLLRALANEGGDHSYFSPVYTPDSRQVALKHLLVGDAARAAAGADQLTDSIVFFTPEGQELFRVGIPPIPAIERPERKAETAPPDQVDPPAMEDEVQQ